MGYLKEKSSYRPKRHETVLAWVFTVASGAALAWVLLRDTGFLGP